MRQGTIGIVLQSHRYKFEKHPVLSAGIRRLFRHRFPGKNGPKDFFSHKRCDSFFIDSHVFFPPYDRIVYAYSPSICSSSG